MPQVPGRKSFFSLEAPATGAASIDVPPGKRAVITRAELELPAGGSQAGACAASSRTRHSVLCITADGQRVVVARLAPSPAGSYPPASQALHLVLNEPAAFNLSTITEGPWKQGADIVQEHVVPKVYLSGYVEDSQ